MTKEEIIKKLDYLEKLLNEVRESVDGLPEDKPKREVREKWCNFCDFCTGPGLPDGIICEEPHHVEAGIREQHQCYSHTCEYHKDSGKVNAYDIHHYE